MTTPAPDDWIRIANIRDVAALELLSRYIRAELTMVEARMDQLKQLDEAVGQRIESLGRDSAAQMAEE